MFEKDLNMAYLLDFYGDILSERKQRVLDGYYNEDLSLSELSVEIGISRQGVRDLIKKAEQELCFYEEKLGLAKKFKQAEVHTQRMLDMLENHLPSDEIRNELRQMQEDLS